MVELSILDSTVAVILTLAVVRGLWIGLLREGFSIAALAGGCLVVRVGMGPFGDWLQATKGGQIGSAVAPWIAGTVLAVATVLTVGIAGRFARRGARAAGLGWADRAGGAALGAAEGTVVAAVLIATAMFTLGRSHPAIESARSVAAFDSLRQLIAQNRGALPDLPELPGLPDVAAPSDPNR